MRYDRPVSSKITGFDTKKEIDNGGEGLRVGSDYGQTLRGEAFGLMKMQKMPKVRPFGLQTRRRSPKDVASKKA